MASQVVGFLTLARCINLVTLGLCDVKRDDPTNPNLSFGFLIIENPFALVFCRRLTLFTPQNINGQMSAHYASLTLIVRLSYLAWVRATT